MDATLIISSPSLLSSGQGRTVWVIDTDVPLSHSESCPGTPSARGGHVGIFNIHVTPKQPVWFFSHIKRVPVLACGVQRVRPCSVRPYHPQKTVIYARSDHKQLHCLFLSRCSREMLLSSPVIPKHCVHSLPWLQEDPLSLYRLLRVR